MVGIMVMVVVVVVAVASVVFKLNVRMCKTFSVLL